MAFPEETVVCKYNSGQEIVSGCHAWANPGNSYDANDATAATILTTTNFCSRTIQGNTHDNTRSVGRITKVEIGFLGSVSPNVWGTYKVRPKFTGGDGTWVDKGAGDPPNIVWEDVTTDANAPSPWNWTHVDNLDMEIVMTDNSIVQTLQLNLIYVRVTYTMEIYINIGDSWKTVTEIQVNIGDVWKDVDDIDINIGDVWKDTE